MAKQNNQLKTILVVVIIALFVYFIFKNIYGRGERYDGNVKSLRYMVNHPRIPADHGDVRSLKLAAKTHLSRNDIPNRPRKQESYRANSCGV